MKQIKRMIIVVICVMIAINIYTTQLLFIYNIPTVEIDIKNLDESSEEKIVVERVSNILTSTKTNIYTSGGVYDSESYIDEIYSNFQNSNENEKYFRLKSGEYPKKHNYVSNQQNDEHGNLDVFIGRDKELRLYNLENLKKSSLNRKYFFIDIDHHTIEKITQVFDEFNIDYTVNLTNENSNSILANKVMLLMLILLFMCLVTDYVRKGKDYAIKSLNGYNYCHIIKDEVMKQSSVIKWIVLIGIIMSIIAMFITKSSTFTLNYLMILIKEYISISVIIILLVIVATYICYILSDLTHVQKQVNYKILQVIAHICKIILIIATVSLIMNYIYSSKELDELDLKMDSWANLEDYYTTGYYYPMNNNNDHIDFETMTLDKIGEESRMFIEKTEDKLNGIIVDNTNEIAYANNDCKGKYNNVCHSVYVNQNYLDFVNLKDTNGQKIIFEDEKLDLVIPENLMADVEKIKKEVMKSINAISPVYNYGPQDIAIHEISDDTCVNLYSIDDKGNCYDGILIEYGSYAYNTDLLLASGGYFFKLPQNEPYKYLSNLIDNDELMYHFKLIEPKTSELSKLSIELHKKQIMLKLKLSIGICLLVITLYFSTLLYIASNIKTIVIKILQGYSISTVSKRYILINQSSNLIVLLVFMTKTNFKIFIIIFIIDLIVQVLFFKLISKKQFHDYIKGKND